jgi:branched-chain amino acid transport system substrate-binding protein
MVLLSPIATTPELSGQKDLFFRIVPTHIAQAQAFCRHIYENRGIGRLAIIYDRENEAFTTSFAQACSQQYLNLGGEITAEIIFLSSTQPDFAALVTQLQESGAESVLIITSALDAAFIAQQIHLQNWAVPLFSSAWAQTDVIIQNGGQTVEGMEFIIAFDVNSPNPVYVDFKTKYEARFEQIAGFAAGEAYEAALVLFAALERTEGQAEGLPEALLQTHNLAGLMGHVSLDEYGDVARTLFIITIQDGVFQTLPVVIDP